MSNLGDVLSIDLTDLCVEKASVLKRITDGVLGAEPPAAGGYGGLGAKPPWFISSGFWGPIVVGLSPIVINLAPPDC